MHGLPLDLSAARLGYFFGIPVTNTLLATWVSLAVLILIAYVVGRRPQLVPGKVQSAFEMLFEYVLSYMEQTLGSREMALRFFPLIMSMFLFIFAANLFEFLPFLDALTVHVGGATVPLLRSANTDLNTTLALALISGFVVEAAGVAALGVWRYGSKFVNVRHGVLQFFIGLIELVSEVARLIAFSFRLFGNIFAGGILIAVAALFVPVVLPVPFILFELFVALVQSAIFALLTLAFLKIAITPAH
ncbi:MAG: F0F1 ATP synthase subunit A [Patescibacteria group bacterium]|nr:F0F1 ATP synthase subunit A [Patescibacteria group bacterium]